MDEYDVRPATAQVRLIGDRGSAAGYAIRDFLYRNGKVFEWVDVDNPGAAAPDLDLEGLDRGLLPVCILPDGRRLAPATVAEVAAGLGMVAAPALAAYDLAVVGAGPAGLGAAVYGASEGLRTVVVEGVAPGGQAGTTSLIENYLGFSEG